MPTQSHTMRNTGSTAAFIILLLMVAISAPGCVVEPTVGPEATATVQAVRKLQAQQALGAGIDMEDRYQISYAGVAYGSGLRYDPNNEDLLARLSRLPQPSPRDIGAYVTPGPTPAPITPSDEVPDAELGLRQFGDVILARLPDRKVVPQPANRFLPREQIAIYVERFLASEITIPMEFRFFDMASGKLIFVSDHTRKNHGLTRWMDRFIWYKTGGETVGSYRVELYSLGRLTHIIPFEVSTTIAEAPTPSPTPTQVPPPPPPARPESTPVPAAPRVVSVSPPADAQGAPGDTPIRAVFDMALDPSTITLESLQVRYSGVFENSTAGVKPLPGELSLSTDRRSIGFIPRGGALPGNATFTASIPAGIRSATGVALQRPFFWTFSTASYGPSWDGMLSNTDFSLGLEGWNVDIAGAGAGFASVEWLQLAEGAGGAAVISRLPGGGLEGMIGLFQNVAFQIPPGMDLSIMLNLLGGGYGGSLKYVVIGSRGGAQFTKVGDVLDGVAEDWTERRLNLTDGRDALLPGDVVNRVGVYASGESYSYQVGSLEIAQGAGPTPTSSPTATPTPSLTPPKAATPTRDSITIPALTMMQVTSYTPGHDTYLVTADITYSLASSPTGVIRLTPYEDESNAGVNWLFELHVHQGSGAVRVSGILIPKPTSQKVRFQAYFRDASDKHIGESYTDNYPLQRR